MAALGSGSIPSGPTVAAQFALACMWRGGLGYIGFSSTASLAGPAEAGSGSWHAGFCTPSRIAHCVVAVCTQLEAAFKLRLASRVRPIQATATGSLGL